MPPGRRSGLGGGRPTIRLPLFWLDVPFLEHHGYALTHVQSDGRPQRVGGSGPVREFLSRELKLILLVLPLEEGELLVNVLGPVPCQLVHLLAGTHGTRLVIDRRRNVDGADAGHILDRAEPETLLAGVTPEVREV